MARNKQISLFDENGHQWEIRKHSSMVQMSNVTTLQERKVMNSLIRIAKDNLKRSPEEGEFQTDVGTIKSLAGLNDTNNVDLKNALRNLAHTKIEYNVFSKDESER